MKRSLLIVLLLGILAACAEPPPPPSSPEPKIDMHMHALTVAARGADGEPYPIPCYPMPDCDHPPTVVRNDEDVMNLALEAMDRHNVVLAVVSWAAGGFGPHVYDNVYEWMDAAPGRFLAGAMIAAPDRVDMTSLTTFLREEFEGGRLQVMGEIISQYRGVAPNDPVLEPIFELAEQLDVPTLIHVNGIGAGNPPFRIAHGHPELLEEVLVRHPNLRLWIENAGYPFLEEAIALMYRYPQVYADLSAITWFIPRNEFYRYLQALMGAGLGSRLMWGSDQINWPGTIDLAVDAIESAPFLTEEQKRDIFYNNAAYFLRLEGHAEEEGG